MPDQQEMDDLQRTIKRWEEETLQPSLDRFPERRSEFITTSSELINRLYTPADLADKEYEEVIGYPGQYPLRVVCTQLCTAPGSGPCACLRVSGQQRKPTRDLNTC